MISGRDSISSLLEKGRLDPGVNSSFKYKLIPDDPPKNWAVSTAVIWGGCKEQDGRRSGLCRVLQKTKLCVDCDD